MRVQEALDLLGLPPTSSFPQVRAQYFQLAKQHHPDKLAHRHPSLRSESEAYFKQVTCAYQVLEAWHRDQGVSNVEREKAEPGDGGGTPQDWRQVWARVEHVMQSTDVWGNMKHVIRTTLTEVVSKTKEELQKRRHAFAVPVTLEELYQGKIKRLQLFLQGVQDPVLVRIACLASHDAPPAWMGKIGDPEKEHEIIFHWQVAPHPVYERDGLDLHAYVPWSWKDHLTGNGISLPPLHVRHTLPVVFHIPAFSCWEEPLRFSQLGLPAPGADGQTDAVGDLYIHLHLVMPTEEAWSLTDASQKENLLNALNALPSTILGAGCPAKPKGI